MQKKLPVAHHNVDDKDKDVVVEKENQDEVWNPEETTRENSQPNLNADTTKEAPTTMQDETMQPT